VDATPSPDDPREQLARTEALLRSTQEELRWSTREREALVRSLAEVQELHVLAAERLRNDLALAREIQRSLLPEPSPEWDGVELRCYSRPALEIGGDFYTYRASANARVLLNKYVLAVGDASGKGVSAALLMAAALGRFDASFSRPLGLAERLAHLDKAILPFTKPRRQSCALCCVEVVGVNTVRPVLRMANAGCIPPYLKRADGSVEWVRSGGPPLGLGLGAKGGYEEVVRPLAKGDMIVLTSDGVVEARDESEELFGFDRLEAAIAAGPTTGTEAMIEHLQSVVAGFLGDQEPHDDVTIAVLRI
jgi:sigma-B regulation protein RsbU (phosphoserine phosphatase)